MTDHSVPIHTTRSVCSSFCLKDLKRNLADLNTYTWAIYKLQKCLSTLLFVFYAQINSAVLLSTDISLADIYYKVFLAFPKADMFPSLIS